MNDPILALPPRSERSNDERGRFSPAERDEGYLACKDWSWRGKAANSLGCLRN